MPFEAHYICHPALYQHVEYKRHRKELGDNIAHP